MKVDNVLNAKGRDFHTIGPDRTIADATAALEEHGIGALIVSEDGTTPIGMLSERDVVRALPHRGHELLGAKVSELMSTSTTCTREDTIAHVMSEMTERRTRHLPVVEHGCLCGLISIGDVVKYRVEELKDEAETLRDYIGAR